MWKMSTNLLGVWAAVLAVGCVNAVSVEAAVRVGQTPKIQMRTIGQKTITNESLRGQIVVLDFWAIWCGPCIQQIPHMKELNEQYAAQGVHMISISLDTRRSMASKYASAQKMNWTHVCDEKAWNSPLVKQFGVKSIPRTVILSPAGKVLWVGHPAHLDKPLASAVKNHPTTPPPSVARTEAISRLKQARAILSAKHDYNQALALLAEVDEQQLYDVQVSTIARSLAVKLDVPEAAEALALHPDVAAKLPAIKSGLHIASGKMGAASNAHEQSNYPMAYRLYVTVAERAAYTQLGHRAAMRAAEYEANVKIQPRLRNIRVEHLKTALFAIAQCHQQAGRLDLARERFKQVADGDFASPLADQSRQALATLDDPR